MKNEKNFVKISFQELKSSHFPLMLRWLEAPHVKKWWDQDISYTMDLVQEKYGSYANGYKKVYGVHKPIKAFIIYADDVAIGYIQIYNVHDFLRNEIPLNLPAECGALDIFIGEEDALGKGLGSRSITQFLKLHAQRYSHVFVDPDAKNIAAIKAYERAGFKKIRSPLREAVWMVYDNPIVSKNNALHYIWGNRCDGFWFKKNGNFTVIKEIMPPKSSEIKHFHDVTEQFFYVLEGALHVEIDGAIFELHKNDGITIHPRVVHNVSNQSHDSVSFLVISCPNSHQDRINMEERGL